jgi:hypothetical protein
MEPLLVCLASVSAAWIAAIAVSERAFSEQPKGLDDRDTEAASQLRWLRFGIAPLIAVWPVLLLVAASGRAIFSTLTVLAVLVGLALANRAKISLLREPLVFFDFAYAAQVLTHPGLYIPVVGTWRVVGVCVAVVSIPTAALMVDAPLWSDGPGASVWPRAGLFAGSALAMAVWPIFVRIYFRSHGRNAVSGSGDPMWDLTRFGLVGSWLVQWTSGRDKEELERIRSHCPELPPTMRSGEKSPQIIVVQAESFFDTRRLFASPDEEPPVTLPNFERACAEGPMSGRFMVSAWGANSLRTEFAVLSMIPETELGVHRFNPYLTLARRPVWTMARHLQALGYRTIWVHPFSKRFFSRDRVYRNLGFDEFLDIDAFAAAPRCGAYVCDRAIADMVGDILTGDAKAQPTFVFAITMEAHGPWLEGEISEEMSARLPTLPASATSYKLARLLYHLRHTDQMIGDLMDLTSKLGRTTVLGLYGDHLPLLTETFERAGFKETATDYAIWRGGPVPRRSKTAPLAPEQFGREVLAAAGLIEAPDNVGRRTDRSDTSR